MQNLHRLLLPLLAVLGAVLGFLLEPLVGRMVTLAFGGAVHVWTVCVLVFQTVLLASYAWVHLVARRFPWAHVLVTALGLFSLPIAFEAQPTPDTGVLTLALQVALAVQVPFFALSSAAVVASTWSREESPWWLYAASNAGSLVGLFAYPLLVEPNLGLHAQTTAWSVLYVVYLVVLVLCAIPARRSTSALTAPRVHWVALAAAPSMLSLALTNWIGTEFGSFPLLWTVPLGLYLGSFMLAFSERLEPIVAWIRPLWLDALVMVALFAGLARESALHPFLYGGFFVSCWLVHAALFRQRPDRDEQTAYYLSIALGGWLGGAVVTIGAPLLFPGLWELPLALALCAVVMLLWDGFDAHWFKRVHWRWGFSRAALTATMAILAVLAATQATEGRVDSVRSLYGVFHVRERTVDGVTHRTLLHGGTVHGSQYLPPDSRSDTPMSYYHPAGGNAEALSLRSGGRIGGIGLGTGAIAALGGPSDRFVFYELDPQAETLARRWFTYLDDQDEVRLGDARLVLASEDSTYDALLVDAFSGDGIPTHLLTVEAFQLYLDHLAADGVLVLHISNRFLELRGVVKANAEQLGLNGLVRFETGDDPALDDPLYGPATTVLLTREPRKAPSERWVRFGDGDGIPNHAAWTDDYLNLLEPLGF